MTDGDNNDMSLVMPFFTDEPEFVLGFEAGQIWQRMKNGEIEIDAMIHRDNMAQIEMICVTFDYKCHFIGKPEGGWILFHAIPY